MFYGCESLTELDLSTFNTNSVRDMKNMFSYCSNFVSLNLFKSNTSSVTNMGCMFCECNSLTSLIYPHLIQVGLQT